MAIYSTFFLALPKDLVSGFPGWKLPLAVPVRRQIFNPWTKQQTWIETREPEWPDDDADPNAEWSPDDVVSGTGSYTQYLEDRLPPFVVARPHWAAKGLTDIELEPLCETLHVSPTFEHAIYARPELGATLQAMPEGFLAALRSADVRAVAVRWAQAMSAPEYTHSVSGNPITDGWTPDDATALLEPLVGLAHKAEGGQVLYLLVEA